MKQCLDIEQMQHLQELGMELKDTMLYWIVYKVGNEKNFVTTRENAMEVIDESCGMLPAYTLQNVLDALPKDISKDGCTWSASLYIDFENNRIAYGNTDRYGFEVYHEIMIEKDLIDAAYEMLCWCIENGYAKIGKEASDERDDRENRVPLAV